jgi:hypothetical protein
MNGTMGWYERRLEALEINHAAEIRRAEVKGATPEEIAALEAEHEREMEERIDALEDEAANAGLAGGW